MSYAVGTIYFAKKQNVFLLLRNQYETAHSQIEQDMMLWGGVFACVWGEFSNKRKARGCFFQGKETKTITKNIIFPSKNWAPWKRSLSHRGCPDTMAGFGLTWHQKVHFSTFGGKLKFRCPRNGSQNHPFCPGSIQDTFIIYSSISHQHMFQKYFAKRNKPIENLKI